MEFPWSSHGCCLPARDLSWYERRIPFSWTWRLAWNSRRSLTGMWGRGVNSGLASEFHSVICAGLNHWVGQPWGWLRSTWNPAWAVVEACEDFGMVRNKFLKIFLFFLAIPRGMWDLGSQTRNRTCSLCTGSTVLTTGPPGKSFLKIFFQWWIVKL